MLRAHDGIEKRREYVRRWIGLLEVRVRDTVGTGSRVGTVSEPTDHLVPRESGAQGLITRGAGFRAIEYLRPLSLAVSAGCLASKVLIDSFRRDFAGFLLALQHLLDSPLFALSVETLNLLGRLHSIERNLRMGGRRSSSLLPGLGPVSRSAVLPEIFHHPREKVISDGFFAYLASLVCTTQNLLNCSLFRCSVETLQSSGLPYSIRGLLRCSTLPLWLAMPGCRSALSFARQESHCSVGCCLELLGVGDRLEVGYNALGSSRPCTGTRPPAPFSSCFLHYILLLIQSVYTEGGSASFLINFL